MSTTDMTLRRERSVHRTRPTDPRASNNGWCTLFALDHLGDACLHRVCPLSGVPAGHTPPEPSHSCPSSGDKSLAFADGSVKSNVHAGTFRRRNRNSSHRQHPTRRSSGLWWRNAARFVGSASCTGLESYVFIVLLLLVVAGPNGSWNMLTKDIVRPAERGRLFTIGLRPGDARCL